MKKTEAIAVETRNLTYSYEGNSRKALNGISIKIRKGEKTAFMGGNGSGKSTFFLCLNGILKPDSGSVFIEEEPVKYTRKGLLNVRKKVGIVFQEPDSQLFSASVYQDIAFGILNLGADEKTARNEVNRVIDKLGIRPYADRPVHALSGGQKKQVAIADILVMHPDIMILDEPAAALDPVHTKIVTGIIDRLTEDGITVLMSTHDMDYAYEWADRIVIMHEGEILEQGTPAEICSKPDILKKSGLDLPAAVKLFYSLKNAGLLSDEQKLPANMASLEQMLIRERNTKI